VLQADTEAGLRTAQPEHEIELEFCGQDSRQELSPKYLADSMIMKACNDVLADGIKLQSNRFSRLRRCSTSSAS